MDLRQFRMGVQEAASTPRGRMIHSAFVLGFLTLVLWSIFVVEAPTILRGGFIVGTTLLVMSATPSNF